MRRLRHCDPRQVQPHGEHLRAEGPVQGPHPAAGPGDLGDEREGHPAHDAQPVPRAARGHLQRPPAPVLPPGARHGRRALHHLPAQELLRLREARAVLRGLRAPGLRAPPREADRLPRPEARESAAGLEGLLQGHRLRPREVRDRPHLHHVWHAGLLRAGDGPGPRPHQRRGLVDARRADLRAYDVRHALQLLGHHPHLPKGAARYRGRQLPQHRHLGPAGEGPLQTGAQRKVALQGRREGRGGARLVQQGLLRLGRPGRENDGGPVLAGGEERLGLGELRGQPGGRAPDHCVQRRGRHLGQELRGVLGPRQVRLKATTASPAGRACRQRARCQS
mmetsp:Transcript_41827/g.130168  ORF Transcript_41827/g.130168 Transcript_41827/m.130168 type:complete len:335 (+) Transcript_41827:953-1957(+)